MKDYISARERVKSVMPGVRQKIRTTLKRIPIRPTNYNVPFPVRQFVFLVGDQVTALIDIVITLGSLTLLCGEFNAWFILASGVAEWADGDI